MFANEEALQTLLQVYRYTPIGDLGGKSPAEKMFGRPVRTICSLQPTKDVSPSSSARAEKQNDAFKMHGATQWTFSTAMPSSRRFIVPTPGNRSTEFGDYCLARADAALIVLRPFWIGRSGDSHSACSAWVNSCSSGRQRLGSLGRQL
ncbi:hypothetical protein pipiens_013179 [Culex pipiens pipiens]|uniref:Uncharacterized protein n=1 Tax=Culex pipiens pipiens TaxID=38569 RepID=A0ABD1CZE8_CULPP